MNPKTRQRAMRGFLASLLQSDLSKFEIKEIAEDLYYGSFGRELGELIRDSMDMWTDADRYNPKSIQESPSTKAIYDTIVRRRIPKRSVIQLMTLASPGLKSKQFSPNASVPELLEKFLSTATQGEIQSFSSILEGEPVDAYLKGISRRNREK
jgi:hypothetical protein